jgi:hypothetical protein
MLDSDRAPYANRSCDTFLQGSYRHDTNVYGDSDVDIVLRTRSVYYSDTDGLSPDERANFDRAFVPATYDLADFKADAIAWLRQHYGDAVRVGPKAIKIAGSGSRRDADVVVVAEFRRYRQFRNSSNLSYEEGVCFFVPDNNRIENFPKQHSENCTSKHQATENWFKPTVRVFKNLRNIMIEQGLVDAKLAPSYFLEGLLYNVPRDRFGGTQTANFLDTLNWVTAADRSQFLCANEQFYLLNDYSPVTWTAAKCDAFLAAAQSFWAK